MNASRRWARPQPVLWVVAGQACLSLAGFLLLVALGRWGSPEALGLFSLGWSVCFLSLSIADTLVYTPGAWLQTQHHHANDTDHSLAARTLAVLLVGLLPISALIGVLQLVLPETLGRLDGSLACAVAALCLRDFVRRHWIQTRRPQLSFAAEGSSALILLTGLLSLHMTLGLSATGAMWMLALSGIGPLLPAVRARHLVALCRAFAHLGNTARACWAYGRWLLMGGLFHVGTQQALPWLAAHVGGTTMAGWWAAGMSVSNAMSPLLTALTNHHRPRFMVAQSTAGRQGLQQAVRDSLSGYLIAPWGMCLAAWVASPIMVQGIYGPSFDPPAPALPWLCAVVGLTAAAAPAQLALLARGQSHSNPVFHGVTLMGLGVGGLLWVSTTAPTVEGLAQAYLGASLLGTTVLWQMYGRSWALIKTAAG